MGKRLRFIVPLIIVAGIIALAVWYLRGVNFEVLNPKGTIGHKERNLMIFTVLLGLIVIIPVFVMTILIAWRYREGNHKAKYSPDWDSHVVAEVTWWGIPILIIATLSVVTWVSTHALDPYKPLASVNKPITIEVIALDWKWLFIYPEQNIASVNYIQIPLNTPINFQITSDTVMNSFWIPQLGGQIYAMPGMKTQLHLEATKAGSYNGLSANISGKGFAGMKFLVKATDSADYSSWVAKTQMSMNPLNKDRYSELSEPSQNVAPMSFSPIDNSIFVDIIDNYMMPATNSSSPNQAMDSTNCGSDSHVGMSMESGASC